METHKIFNVSPLQALVGIFPKANEEDFKATRQNEGICFVPTKTNSVLAAAIEERRGQTIQANVHVGAAAVTRAIREALTAMP